MTRQAQAGGTALVIGASMAGLLAARVLAGHYEQVVIVERDTLPPTPETRRGVPQARHAHGLLGHGLVSLEALFPGFAGELLQRGARQGGARIFSGGGYLARVDDGPQGLFLSRPLLEHAVRTRVDALPNVAILENTDAREPLADAGCARITGLQVRERAEGAVERVIPADLVVDATGRGSRAPAWLTALGYPEPREELVDVDMHYSTRIFQRTSEDIGGDMLVNVAPTPDLPRASAMIALEDERWMVTLAGYFGEEPPTGEQGFLEFARSLPAPEIFETIRSATPLSEPATYRFRANLWRHYERLERFPEGFLVIGDALCSFTPIYGQGMTVAALEAIALRACLAPGTDQLAKRFFQQAAKVIANPWSITVGNDRKLSPAGARRDPFTRAINWYLDRYLVAARNDATLSAAFMQVANLFDPPSALLRPKLAARVLRRQRRSRLPHRPAHEQPEGQGSPARV